MTSKPVPPMIERVAAALGDVKAKDGRRGELRDVIDYLWGIAESEDLEPQTSYGDVLRLLACAAIEAMRKPTQGVLDALGGLHDGRTSCDEAWGEIIDAALSEKP